MSINDISTCLIGGRSCGVGREEDASNLLWCEHCGIALCFDCDTDLHNSKNLKHGHLRVLLPASRTETVRKCEHGADGSSNVRLGLITKPSPPKSKRRSSKKERGVSSRLSSSSHNDDEDGIVKASETSELSSIETSEKAASGSLKLPRSALRGGHEKAGLGLRPVHHVTWHPDVKEPICSLVSHTVGHKRAPAFLSRRSQQKHLRQKSKASSKSQARAKKQDKHKKSEPVKHRIDAISDLLDKRYVSSEIAVTPTDEDFCNPMWSNCTDCIQDEGLCDCVNMSDGSSINDPYLQSILLESAVQPESVVKSSVQDTTTVNAVDKKSPTFTSEDESLDDFSGEYRQLLASMFHAATSLNQSKTLGSNVKFEAASGLFRDMKMHAPSTSLSGSEQAFKQATQGKISPWISVV